MRRSRVFRFIIRFFVLFLTACVSFVSFLGGTSSVRILSDPENIAIPDGDIDIYFNVTDLENSHIKVPFNITNAGYFDLTNFILRFDIIMIYNSTHEIVKIYEKEANFQDIPKGQTLREAFETDSSDFINVPEDTYIDFSEPLSFKANVTVGASYALNLLSISVKIYNFDIGSV